MENYWQTVGVTGYNQFAVPEEQVPENTQPDLAIPDHNLTLRELVERYSRGLPIGKVFDQSGGITDDEEEYIPDPRTLDLAEREQYANYAKSEITRIRTKKSQKAENEFTQGEKGEN